MSTQSFSEIEITPEMIEAGVRAYVREAAHDDMSFSTRENVVESILLAALEFESRWSRSR
jgi:predicted peroxiredoxin